MRLAEAMRSFWDGLELRRLVDHFESRLFELATSLMMIGMAVHIALWPDAIAAGAFRPMLGFMSIISIFVFYALFGVLRLAALVANGRWRYGPHLRAVCAFFAAFIWGQMGAALLVLIPHGGNPPSPEISVYFLLAFFEVVSMYRALVLVGNAEIP